MYERIFGPDGTLARSLERYEPRPVQQSMAQAVHQACEQGGLLLLEAGTGVGKSLAYLAPLLQWTAKTGRRAVVSTCTKTLQQQLLTQDVPLAIQATECSVAYALALGAENYLCRQRLLHALRAAGREVRLSPEFLSWANATPTGIRDECPHYISERAWQLVCRSREQCPPRVCYPGGTCYFQRARAEMQKANLLIANHYLLFSDLRAGNAVLADYDVLILDEAHDLEDIATDFLSDVFSRGAAIEVLARLGLPDDSPGLLDYCAALDDTMRHKLRLAANQTYSAIQQTCIELEAALHPPPGRSRVKRDLTAMDHVTPALQQLYDAVQEAAHSLRETNDAGMLDGVQDSINALMAATQTVFAPPDDDTVRWVEKDERGVTAAGASPIKIGEILRRDLYNNKLHTVVLVSATLRVNKKFDFISSRLGAENAATRAFDSPFDYANHMFLYVPSHGPEPEAGEDYLDYLAIQIQELTQRIKGGCFVLFTNRGHLKAVHERLMLSGLYRNREDPPGLQATRLLLQQGELERDPLLRLFKNDGRAVLLGTNTFWQGVDVPGEALRCVILCRLPFRTPDDPILEARLEKLRVQGKNPFTEYQLPQAVMMFLQGVGRLIRHKSDTGVIAILDQRIRTKSYGMVFYRSLPPCRGTSDLNELAAWASRAM